MCVRRANFALFSRAHSHSLIATYCLQAAEQTLARVSQQTNLQLRVVTDTHAEEVDKERARADANKALADSVVIEVSEFSRVSVRHSVAPLGHLALAPAHSLLPPPPPRPRTHSLLTPKHS
jgi:hypothetical protein